MTSGHTFNKDDAEFGAQMLEGLKVVIGEDLMATREIEQMIALLDDRLPPDLLRASDATCARRRTLFEGMIDAERASASPSPTASDNGAWRRFIQPVIMTAE